MIWTLFIIGVMAAFTGLYAFDNQRTIAHKLSGVLTMVIGVGIMLGAMYLRGAL